MDVTELKRLKDLEEANWELKAIYAELALDLKLAKDMDPMLTHVCGSEKSFEALLGAASGGRGAPATASRHVLNAYLFENLQEVREIWITWMKDYN